MSPRNLTRRQAKAKLDPMRRCFLEMRGGYSMADRGYPVTRRSFKDKWERIDHCIAGFRALAEKLLPSLSLEHMARIERRLSSGILVSQADIEGALREIREAENHLITVTRAQLASTVLSLQISFEVEALSMNKEAA